MAEPKKVDLRKENMIQDIEPKFLKNHYEDKPLKEDSRVLIFQGRELYVKNQGAEIEYLTYKEWEVYWKIKGKDVPQCIYLFSISEEEEVDFFLGEIAGEAEFEIPEYTFMKMFDLRSKKPKELVYAGATAWHLYVWYRANRFCGACGKPMVHDKMQRMMRCPCCGNMVFPKIAPAVIVGLINGDKILMTKYADREYTKYALIAGFTEIGETAEETVSREVMEEVGLRVKNITYYKSQPWGFDSNLLLGYFCELDDDSEIILDHEELALAEWVDYHDIQIDTEKLSLTREMMETFRAYKMQEEKTHSTKKEMPHMKKVQHF